MCLKNKIVGGKRCVTLFLRNEYYARSRTFKSVCFAWLYLMFNVSLRRKFDTASIWFKEKNIANYRRYFDVIDNCPYWERIKE